MSSLGTGAIKKIIINVNYKNKYILKIKVFLFYKDR